MSGEINNIKADGSPSKSVNAGEARWQAALFRLSAELAVSTDEADIYKRVVNTLHDTLGYDFVVILLLDAVTGYRELAASVGYENPPSPIPPGKGLSERPLLDGQLHYSPDVKLEERYFYGMGGSEVDVPIRIGGDTLGVLTAEKQQANAFTQDDFEVLTVAAQQMALAIEKARLFEAERRRANQLDALRTILADITAELELSSLLKVIVERAAQLLNATGGELSLFNEGTKRIEIVVSHNLSRDYSGCYQELGEGAMGRVASTLEPLIIENYQTWEGRLEEYPDIYSSLAVPLKIGERLLGVFSTVSTDPARRFTHDDLHILSLFAQQASIAINNAHLFESTQHENMERKRVEAELREYQDHLEELVDKRTAELKNSEQQYRSLFNGLPIGLYRSTPDGRLLESNPALQQMLGYPVRELLLASNTHTIYVDRDEYQRWRRMMDEEGVVRDFETRLYRYDGTVIWGRETARAVRDEEGNLKYYEGSVEDISRRKQTEAQLREYQEHLEVLVEKRTAELQESEERYRTLFDRVPVGLYRSTPAGELIDTNRAMIEMLGYPDRESILAIHSTDHYVDPHDQVRWKEILERDGIVRGYEGLYRRYDGSKFWFNETTQIVRDEDGKTLYYEGSLEDITERKKIEAELRSQKEYYEALFIYSPVAVITADRIGTIVTWNPMAEKLFGYAEEEVIGKNLDDVVTNNDTMHREANEYTHAVIEVGQVEAITQRCRRDGTLIDVDLLALPVIVGEEKVGFIVIYVDITDLQEARRQAEAANRAKSIFLANMSHELRTPLNAILGFTQLMEHDGNLTDSQVENMRIINSSGEHLLTLINDVLQMSKIEAGRIRLQENEFDLHAMLSSLDDIFRRDCEEKGLGLELEINEDVPVFINTDENKLRQVLINLLSNAVKFTRQGSIHLRVFQPVLVDSPAGDRQLPVLHLAFQVEDSGQGIRADDLDLIFEPFSQAESEQLYSEGTGLGLSISRDFVRLMGGELTVESEFGRGSIFSLDIAARPAEASAVDQPQSARQVLGIEPGKGPFRLLVVEENEANRRLLAALLQPVGFEILEAENGLQGVEMWKQHHPDLIWMDLRLPVMDGIEATRQIKSDPDGQKTVIIALTASAFEEERADILAQGCDDFVRKPYRKEEIFEILRKHLGVKYLYAGEGITSEKSTLVDAGAFLRQTAAISLVESGLESDWLVELKRVTIIGDQTAMLKVINKLDPAHRELGEALRSLLENFEYAAILGFVEQAGQGGG